MRGREGVMDLLPMNRNLGGSDKSKLDAVAMHTQNRNDDFVCDDNLFTDFSSEYQHEFYPPCFVATLVARNLRGSCFGLIAEAWRLSQPELVQV
jgi:hypothetical protein